MGKLPANDELIRQSVLRVRQSRRILTISTDCLDRAVQLRAALLCLDRRPIAIAPVAAPGRSDGTVEA